MITDLVVVICLLLYPVAKACTDLRRDTGIKNVLYQLCVKFGWVRWWVGGNEEYNPALIFTADFWHFFEHIKALCIASLAGCYLYVRTGWGWWFILPIGALIYGAIGRVFELLYRYVWSDEKAGSVRDWLKYSIFFWRNSH